MEKESLVSKKPNKYFSPSLAKKDTLTFSGKKVNHDPLSTSLPFVQRDAKEYGGTAIAIPALVHERVKYTTDLARLSTSNPLLAFTLTVVMFSIAGIPPISWILQ